MRKGSIVKRTNMFGNPIGDYLKVVSIDRDGLVRCKYVNCDVYSYISKKRIKELKKCTIKVSAEDYLKLKVANIGLFKHLTTAQYSRLEDELPDVIMFCSKGRKSLYYQVGMVYPVLYKYKRHTIIELNNLINK